MTLLFFVVALAATAVVPFTLAQTAPPQPSDVPVFKGTYGSSMSEHYRFGLEMGKAFKDTIHTRFFNNTFLEELDRFYHTSEGQSVYETMVAAHNRTFPLYMAELQGISDGAEIDFPHLFIENVQEEYSTFDTLPTRSGVPIMDLVPRHCSDYMLVPFNCHNEDGGFADMGNMYYVDVTIDEVSFTAFVYGGDLPTGAFGWNEFGLAITLNWLGPNNGDVNGMGRVFIARDVLNSRNISDAVYRATVAHPQATGHNYQIMSFPERRIVTLETAPFGLFNVMEINSSVPYFHANMYLHLNVSQQFDNSSIYRSIRVSELPPPKTIPEMLTILGDQAIADWPIFHDNYSQEHGDQYDGVTITTMSFDLDAGVAIMYIGNPRNRHVLKTFQIWKH